MDTLPSSGHYWSNRAGMKLWRRSGPWAVGGLLLAAAGVAYYFAPRDAGLWPLLETTDDLPSIAIIHPLEGAVVPANLPSPVVAWNTNSAGAESWVAGLRAGDVRWAGVVGASPWHPPENVWRRLKAAARTSVVEVTVAACKRGAPPRTLARGQVRFRVAAEALDSPLFFREVNLPFAEAVKDPSQIRWRFGSIATLSPPPVVLEKLPVCGNCHSFSRDGAFLAMDVDYANSKASYVIARTAPKMRLATSDIITWNDYRREDGQQTFGLLSQISPDGRYVLSTVKDRSVFVPRPDLAFSQLFFPLKGIVAVYDCQTKAFFALPGADDPAYVQSNPVWSPDGQWVVFARTLATELEKQRETASVLLTPEECEEFLQRGKTFRYDLYRLPFNGGKGGAPQPLRGASHNGRSNYFPKYSPDGRWIVFCQASNYMLLQPDSELYVIPAEGGEPRRLQCNLGRMNSWHTWSPDGKWLVFSSKAHSDYTQLYLTRIGEDGAASPPVWLDRLLAPGRAANIPEFVALPTGGIRRIREEFLDDYSFTRAGNELMRGGDPDRAIAQFTKALELNPNNAMAHQRLGFLWFRVKGQIETAIEHSRAAIRLEPQNGFAHFDLGMALLGLGDVANALPHLAEAVRLLPNGYDRQYNAVEIHFAHAQACYQLGRYADCLSALRVVLRYSPSHAKANHLMAMTLAWMGETETTRPYFEQAVRSEARLGQLPDYHDLLSRNYVNQALYAEGLTAAETGYRLASAAGRAAQAAKLQQRAEYCRSQLSRQ